MLTKYSLGIEEARRMLAAARAEAERHHWAVTIAIVDEAGHLLLLERLDGALLASIDIAVQKARSAALLRLPTKALEDMVKERPALVTMPGVIRVQGGLPIWAPRPQTTEGGFVGAPLALGGIGVSGVKSAEDEQVAEAGIAELLRDALARA